MADDKPLPQIEYPYESPIGDAADSKSAADAAARGFEHFAEAPGKAAAPAGPIEFSPRHFWAMAALMLLVAAVFNVVAVPVLQVIAEAGSGPNSPWDIVIACGLGLIGSQMLVLSGALVWSNRAFVLRLVVLWLVGMALYGCWYLGVELAVGRDDWLREDRMQVARIVLASLPAVSLAVQAPQWLARFYLGWSLAAPAVQGAVSAPRKMSIRDFMIGTVIAALTVAPMRLSVEDPADITTAFWAGWAIAAAILAVLSAVVNLPLLFLVLRVRNSFWALGFTFLGIPTIVGTFIAIVSLFDEEEPGAWLVAILMLVGTSCVAATSLPLWLARLAGYRLAIRGDVPAWKA